MTVTTPYSTVEQAQTAATAAAGRLANAEAEFDEALDRGTCMAELRLLDAQMARATQDHAAALSTVRQLQLAAARDERQQTLHSPHQRSRQQPIPAAP